MGQTETQLESRTAFAERYGNFIGGKLVAPSSGKYFENVTVLQHDANSLATLDKDPIDAGLRPDFASVTLECASDRLRDGAHAATSEPPRADVAIDVAHDMVQQDVGRSG